MKTAIHTAALLLLSLFACSEHSQESGAQQAQQNMVKIPEGRFTMGGKSPQARRDEFPRHEVQISAFYMDVHEVTKSGEALFCATTATAPVTGWREEWGQIKTPALTIRALGVPGI